MAALVVFIIATLEIVRKLNCWAQKVHSVHNKQILKGGSYKAFDNLGAATWKDPSPIAEP